MSAEWLLTWAVQTLALMALAGLTVRLPVCRDRAAARSAAWSATLALCAALMVWPWLEAPGGPVAGPAGPGVVAGAAFSPVVVPEPAGRLWPWFAWVWAAGAAGALVLVARDVVRVLRLKRRTRPLSGAARHRLGTAMSLVATSRSARVCWCDALDTPAVLGFSRPIIGVPTYQAARLSDEQFQHVVLHELAHVRRRDDWWTLAEHVISAVMWVNPAVHLARRQSAVAREMACDEWVVRGAASPAAYARCLTEVAGLRLRTRRLRFAAAATGGRGMLRRRILSVLALDRRPPARAMAVLAWLAPVAVCVAAAGLLQLPPVFVGPAPAAIVADAAGVVDGNAPVSPPVAPAPARTAALPASGRRAAPSRRTAPATPAVARPETDDRRTVEASAADLAAPPPQTPPQEPLPARPLPGAGAPGVVAASGAPGSVPASPAPRESWWSGPRESGGATGGAAVAAGSATASLFKRVGASVPKMFTK